MARNIVKTNHLRDPCILSWYEVNKSIYNKRGMRTYASHNTNKFINECPYRQLKI